MHHRPGQEKAVAALASCSRKNAFGQLEIPARR